MKILHLVSYFPPGRIGGVGEVVAHLHQGLLDAGQESRVLTTGIGPNDPTVERVACSPTGFMLHLPRRLSEMTEFDVIHCHQGDAVLLTLAMRLWRVRTPIVATFHVGHRGMGGAFRPYRLNGQLVKTGWQGWKYRNFNARFHWITDMATVRLADASAFIARSTAIDILGAEKGKATRTIIYNGLPDSHGAETTPPLESTELLYVGTESHRKRVFALPFVLQQVRRTIPTARLRLVGVDLAASSDLRLSFHRLGVLDAVVCEGQLPSSAALAPFYRAARVLVAPSAYEGLPMVILEALRDGLPCVASRVSGCPEVIEDGKNGFLVEKDNPEQMAERCIELLKNPHLQQRMGDYGRTIVARRFTLQRQVTEYLELYQRVRQELRLDCSA